MKLGLTKEKNPEPPGSWIVDCSPALYWPILLLVIIGAVILVLVGKSGLDQEK